MTYRVFRCQPSSYLEKLIVSTGVNWPQDETTQHVNKMKEFNAKLKSLSIKCAPLEDKSDELKKPNELLGGKQVHSIANRVKRENRSLTAGCGDLRRSSKVGKGQKRSSNYHSGEEMILCRWPAVSVLNTALMTIGHSCASPAGL